ncbi:single-strand DNA-binding protein [Antricoccus suffuscus]|uniref:Single-stranded DNA-binding protein n=1 Tax=Antricoccus suffuscus TaxID=1629062 RepID=A0A2T0ZU92_9ACTN|nr:single-stranded DNA-binding protein [Antricoccus suffuscus]PRZ39658.1 single-strand DNA-binding protein [Antricoccus suffuscus]
MSTTLTVEGNLVADPELKFTPSGHALATFAVAVNNREKKAGEWVDAPATYHDIEAWKTLGENVATSLCKGNGVIVTGVIRTHTWEDKTTGQQRSRNTITAYNVAASLKYATAAVHKAERRSDNEISEPASQF